MRRLVALAAVVAAALAACGGPDATYLRSDRNSYLKIPNEWHLFEEEDLVEEPERGLFADAAAPTVDYAVAFDAAPDASLSHVAAPWTAAYPNGFNVVRGLNPRELDEASRQFLRNSVVDFDRLYSEGQLEYREPPEELEGPDGLIGTKLVYDVKLDASRVTLEQVSYMDPVDGVLYQLLVGCETSCYLEHENTIKEVTKSWTVKERRGL